MKDMSLKWGMNIAEAKEMIPKDNPMQKQGPIKVSVGQTDDHGNKTEYVDFEGKLGEFTTENALVFKNGKLDSIITRILGITKSNVMISYASIKQSLVEQFGSPEADLNDDDSDKENISYSHHWVNVQKDTDARLFIGEYKDGTIRADLYFRAVRNGQ
jgi:hypothetical protein